MKKESHTEQGTESGLKSWVRAGLDTSRYLQRAMRLAETRVDGSETSPEIVAAIILSLAIRESSIELATEISDLGMTIEESIRRQSDVDLSGIEAALSELIRATDGVADAAR